MVYANFGGQTKCIMGNVKMVNSQRPASPGLFLCQIPHYAELSSCQMFGVCPREVGGGGGDWVHLELTGT